MAERAEAEFEILNQLGLHARAAAQLVQTANRYRCDVSISCEGQQVNGKSIMGVLMLAAGQGMIVTVVCNGPGAAECLSEISQLIENKFGEGK